jgi:hypothetical protein
MSLRNPATRRERIVRYSIGVVAMIAGTVQCIIGHWWGVLIAMVGAAIVAEEDERRRVRNWALSGDAYTDSTLRPTSD